MKKYLEGFTERNEEPVKIILEQSCPKCCYYDEFSTNTGVSVKTEYADYNPRKLNCNECNDSRTIINKNGLKLIDFIAKHLRDKNDYNSIP